MDSPSHRGQGQGQEAPCHEVDRDRQTETGRQGQSGCGWIVILTEGKDRDKKLHDTRKTGTGRQRQVDRDSQDMDGLSSSQKARTGKRSSMTPGRQGQERETGRQGQAERDR
jgi:hypothetical protein